VDEPLAQYQGLTTSYFHADGLGSVTSLTDGSGQLADSYVYDSFGNLTASTGTITNPFQYTGREYDPETGLYYYRARYFDPVIGRFISQDPVGFGAGLNFYAYVRGNPANLIDPSGLTSETNAAFFWGWWNGLLPNKINYGPNDIETQEMAKSPGASFLRQFFVRRNATT
jgi:RHS repeat-associated protein